MSYITNKRGNEIRLILPELDIARFARMGCVAETHSNFDIYHDFRVTEAYEVFIKLDSTLLEELK